MSKRFVVADTHFGHAGVCKFLRDDGTKLRPWDDPIQMDVDMVELWNETVGPKDTVYHLGDVVINRKALPTLGLLNGRKILIKGNHDIFRLEEYTKYFEDIRAYHVVDDLIFSHIPVHSGSKGRFRGNIHGHLHQRRVLLPDGTVDPWYLCVSVEHTDFKPVELHIAGASLTLQQMLHNAHELGLEY